jgi:hypothetical protein
MCVDFMLFNTNHCHIHWEGRGGGTINSVSISNFFGEGRVKPLWVFEFQIITLHLQLVLNFNCSPKGGVRSYC